VQQVQHHKAHVLSVIAEHGLKGKVLGFAFDGTGYGDDGSIWGSEAFVWEEDLNTIQRVAHLKPAKLIGGDEGAKNCDTILSGMLHGNNLDALDENDNSTLLAAALDNNINVVTSTSMGRLFDAVSAMLDVCHYNSYEGQAPIELENVAATAEKAYKLQLHADGDTTELFRGIAYAIEKHIPKEEIARGFIEAVANFVVEIADSQSINQVVLSGGTFLNRILTEKVIDDLEAKGYKVYMAEQLPAGDGGICLGQVFYYCVQNYLLR
jgi:hydrogenase maturation protein HypF